MQTLSMKHSLSQLFKPACCVTVALVRVGQEMTLHKTFSLCLWQQRGKATGIQR
jgi:hypothetical protein